MKAAIYCRVSTEDQHTENQLPIPEKWAVDRGWEVVERYEDTGSAFQRTNQKQLNRLLADCDKGKYELVLVCHVLPGRDRLN